MRRIFVMFTLQIEETIQRFVEQYGTMLFRAHIDGKQAIVKYDYHDRWLELEFEEQNPLEYQLDIYKNLTLAKYEKEKTKCEVGILKHRLLYNHLPNSFHHLQLPSPISLHTITNETLRQRLQDKCEKIFQQTKSHMMMVYIATAEAQFKEKAMKFDTALATMHDNQSTGSIHKKLTPTMLDILQRRLRNIDERLTYLYKLKVNFFVKAPTVKSSI